MPRLDKSNRNNIYYLGMCINQSTTSFAISTEIDFLVNSSAVWNIRSRVELFLAVSFPLKNIKAGNESFAFPGISVRRRSFNHGIDLYAQCQATIVGLIRKCGHYRS